jgi:proteasome lid subunit RPN8/RPN11
MSQLRVHMQPPESQVPHLASLPLEKARHWISPYEGEGDEAPISVFLTQNARNQAVLHASSDLDNEVGGILVGKWCADSETTRQFIVITATLPARFTQQGRVFLTFTQDSLVDFHEKIEEMYPEDVIVGWYHTHPRMGVFLSHYDAWLHKHFFPEAWQVALVIEPHSEIGGFFVRQADGVLDPSRYFGFYELEDDSGETGTHWKNLQQQPAGAEKKGVDPNE